MLSLLEYESKLTAWNVISEIHVQHIVTLDQWQDGVSVRVNSLRHCYVMVRRMTSFLSGHVMTSPNRKPRK